MKRKERAVLLIALLTASLLAGSFLTLFPVWERMREKEKEGKLLGLIREKAEGEAWKIEERKGKEAETGNGWSGRETAQKHPAMISKSEEITTERKDGMEVQGYPMRVQRYPMEENDAVVQGHLPEETAEVTGSLDGITGIGILAIPKIDAELPVTAGVSEKQLKVSEGWLTQSSPVGSIGNAVIAGHRSYTYGRHFNRLGELESGDEIFYTGTEGERMQFIVREILVTDPEDPAVFALPPEGVAQLTLYTCTPVRIASHRLIIRAERTE